MPAFLQAQDPQFTQFFNAPSYLNPAFTGALGEQFVGAVNYRRQWSSLGTGYNTFSAAFDYATTDRLSFGLLVMNDQAGQAGLTTSGVALISSYVVPLSSTWNFQPAFQAGIYDRSLNFNELVFVDEILFDNPGAIEGGTERASFLNFSTGFLLYSNYVWMGASLHNVARPIVMNGNNALFLNERLDDQFLGKVSIHTGANIPLPDPDYSAFAFAVYKQQGNARQFDLTGGATYQNFSLGMGYRSFFNPGSELSSRDAVSAILAVNQSYGSYNVNIGYSYDLTVSELSRFSNGSHEISIVLKASSDRWLKVADKRRIFCPMVSRNGFNLQVAKKSNKRRHFRRNDRSGKPFKKNKPRKKRKWLKNLFR